MLATKAKCRSITQRLESLKATDKDVWTDHPVFDIAFDLAGAGNLTIHVPDPHPYSVGGEYDLTLS